MKKLIFALIGFLLVCGIQAQEIPQKISYQGKLLENGDPVTGEKNITFSFSIGTWSEEKIVQITDGIYSVTLGETSPIPTPIFDDNISVMLQISVEGNTLSPHTEILSVPYSYKSEKAADAERIDGNPVSGTPSDGQVLKWNGSYWTPLNDESLIGTPAGGDLGGIFPNLTVIGIQNIPVSSTAPTDEQVLKFDGSQWSPQEDNTHPTGPAEGDLDDNYPNPTVIGLQNQPISSTAPTDEQVLKFDGSQWAPQEDNTHPTGPADGDLDDNYPDPTVIGIQNQPISSTDPTDEQVLKFDGSQWAPENDGLSLPYTAIYYGGSDAFHISSQGSGGIASFYIPNNNANVLSVSTDGDGKAGIFTSNSSFADNAVYIDSWSNTNAALEVYNAGSANAADFDGDVDINGNLSKSGGTFKIDHPLDPENKYLYHSFVESPDMLNIYNGNITLDNNGEVIVILPEWFEALNSDFRYQLTCIGGFAQVYISEEISNNTFKISGGKEGLIISWQVTGIRQDPWAVQNRVQVEVEKAEQEKGYYLHYKEYKQPIEKSIIAIKNPELIDNNKK